MTSLRSGYRYKYGVAGAGAVWKSLIGRLPGKARDIGPVVGVSARVASRIANALKAGAAVRDLSELKDCRSLLFHAPPDQAAALLAVLETAAIDWDGKPVVVCDCEVKAEDLARLTAKGARVAWAQVFAMPGYLVVRGAESPARTAAQTIARELRLRALTVTPEAEAGFDAAITLATAAFTPLIDRVAGLFRQAGVRETEASRLAAMLFRQTAADYGHSGKQSWAWYVRQPDAEALAKQIGGAGVETGEILRRLALLGCEAFERHAETARLLRDAGARSE